MHRARLMNGASVKEVKDMHNIEYETYAENCNRKAVKKDLDTYVAHADYAEGASGLYNEIRWIEIQPLPSRHEAMEYIERHDRNCYDNLAVRYFEADDSVHNTPKYKELNDRVQKLNKEYEALAYASYPKSVKSALITCKRCGSKIATKFYKTNYCPVCDEDFRSKTTLDRIKNKKEAVEKATKALEQYKSSYALKHGKIYWLVKFEYHT